MIGIFDVGYVDDFAVVGCVTIADFADSPSNLKLPKGEDHLSFRSSLSNPYPGDPQPTMRPGREYVGIDPSGLPPGSVIVDNVPPGHVSVYVNDVDLLRSLIVEKGRFPK